MVSALDSGRVQCSGFSARGSVLGVRVLAGDIVLCSWARHFTLPRASKAIPYSAARIFIAHIWEYINLAL